MSRFSLAATFLLATLPSLIYAQGTKPITRVKLTVTCDECANLVRSYMSRELRAIGDVALVDDHPDFEFKVVALATYNQRNVPTGYTMAVLLLDWTLGQFLANILEGGAEYCTEPSKGIFMGLARGGEGVPKAIVVTSFCQVLNLEVRSLPPEKLESECRKIIAEFDGGFLEVHRKYLPEPR